MLNVISVEYYAVDTWPLCWLRVSCATSTVISSSGSTAPLSLKCQLIPRTNKRTMIPSKHYLKYTIRNKINHPKQLNSDTSKYKNLVYYYLYNKCLINPNISRSRQGATLSLFLTLLNVVDYQKTSSLFCPALWVTCPIVLQMIIVSTTIARAVSEGMIIFTT